MRKFDGRDHLVIEVKDREVLIDFMNEFAEIAEDEVIVEANEEFSMLVNASPIWFSFDDIDRCKREANKLIAAGSNVLTGYLELKQTGAMNVFRSLFAGQQACWERKYFVLKGTQLCIYHTDASQLRSIHTAKPQKVINLTQTLTVKEVRRSSAGGKQHAFSLQISPNPTNGSSQSPAAETYLIAALSFDTFDKWVKALRSIKPPEE